MATPIRIGLIGCGRWGVRLARVFSASPDFELAALCDRDPQRLQRLAETHRVPRIETDLEALLEPGELQALAVATPAREHVEPVRAALEKGLHVLAEKPLAPAAAAAEPLIAAATAADRVLLTDHTELYSAPFLRLAERLADAGPVRSVALVHVNSAPGPEDVDILWDLAPHDFALLERLFHAPAERVTVLAGSPHPAPDTLTLAVEYPGDRRARIELARAALHRRRSLTVRTERLRVSTEGLGPSGTVRVESAEGHGGNGNGGRAELLDAEGPEPLGAAAAEFAALIRGERPRPDGASDLRILRALEAAAAARGRYGEMETSSSYAPAAVVEYPSAKT